MFSVLFTYVQQACNDALCTVREEKQCGNHNSGGNDYSRQYTSRSYV